MRRSGVLMPLSSLPSPCGIGTMGAAAREFVDFLVQAGQSCWQLLPICPTSYGDSPYQSFSTFAGNPYFIDLDALARAGLLEEGEYRDVDWECPPDRVNYGALYEKRYPLLRSAAARLLAAPPEELDVFCRENASWLSDYALFMALKDKFGGASWSAWPEDLRLRRPAALAAAQEELAEDIRFWKAVQYLFFHQWRDLKGYANRKGVSIIGDLPIYVSGDSADVWASPEQFQLDGDGVPTEVAGCPPDGFSADGQLWGNPLFDWERMKKDGYAWWLRRIAFQFQLYDTLRIDHFRGFDEYFAVPFGDRTAHNGRWRPGPGIDFFQTVDRVLGRKDIIAEDLGFLTPSVKKLLRDSGYPGMKVLELAFDSRDGSGSEYLPHAFPTHCVAYTGTHDNQTIQGWLATASPEDVRRARDYFHLTAQEGYHWGMLRGLWSSVADLTVVQAQDLLGLGEEARMNTPSTVGDNWRWRALPGAFDGPLAGKVRRYMELYGRLPE